MGTCDACFFEMGMGEKLKSQNLADSSACFDFLIR